MPDPYCWPDPDCLRNKLGLRDGDRLERAEARIVSAREVLVARETIPGEYGLDHVKAFHRALFRDVYGWAGETRTVDIALPGSTFGHWRYVDEDVSSVLRRLATVDGLLIGSAARRSSTGRPSTTARPTRGPRSGRATAAPSGPSSGSWAPRPVGTSTGRA